MAQVTILIDTERNEMNLTIDGQQISNVQGLSVYKYSEYENGKLEEELAINIQVVEEMPGDMVKQSYISKSEEIDNKIKFEPVTAKSGLEHAMKLFVLGSK